MAGEGLLCAVLDQVVIVDLKFPPESFAANIASERLLSGVEHHMILMRGITFAHLLTVLALVFLLGLGSSLAVTVTVGHITVFHQLVLGEALKDTLITLQVLLLVGVVFQIVQLEAGAGHETPVAIGTLERFFRVGMLLLMLQQNVPRVKSFFTYPALLFVI